MPYITQYDKGSLEYWEYDKLGTTASAGCVRLTVADAQWIYNNCVSGTKVEFYSDDNPGPLGKPTSRIISNDLQFRDWDPTDPAPDNPWKNYQNKKETDETPEIKLENTVENEVTNSMKENIISSNENSIKNNIVANSMSRENMQNTMENLLNGMEAIQNNV